MRYAEVSELADEQDLGSCKHCACVGSSPIFRMYYVSSYNLISDRVEIFISVKCDMRKCRNWQTSKTKDLVSIALVWVQVPSSAFFIAQKH